MDQPSDEEHDGSGIEEGSDGVDCGLNVLCETTVAVDPGEEAFDEPEVSEAQSRPTPRQSNRSGNAAPYGYAALGRSASTRRLQDDLSNTCLNHIDASHSTPFETASKTIRITPIAL